MEQVGGRLAQYDESDTGSHRLRRRQLIAALIFLTPASIAVLALIIYPMFSVLHLSFRVGDSMNFTRLHEQPLGLGNYTRLLSDGNFWNSAYVSLVYVLVSVTAASIIALGTALLLNANVPFRRFFRTLILLPWAVPGVIASIVFIWMFDGSFGVVNGVLRSLGIISGDPAWFIDRDLAVLAVTFPTIWKAYPLITLLLLTAMQSIPAELYEAAKVDGATRFQLFRFVTWPGIRATAILAILVSALWIFTDLDIIYGATQGGPSRSTETLAIYVYNEAFQFFRMGIAAAAGAVMIVAAASFTFVALRMLLRDRF